MVVNERLRSENALKTHIMEIFNNLSELCDISLIIPYSNVEIPQNEHIIMYKKHNFSIPFIHLITLQMAQFFVLFKLFKQKKPDIIYSRLAPYSFSPPLFSKLFKVPLIVEMNGILREELEINKKSAIDYNISKFFLNLTESINFSSASKIVAVTPGIQDYIQTNYNFNPHDIEVIPNGVNSNLFRPIDITTAKRYVGLKNDITYIGFVGNLAGWQGLESLIQAIPKISNICPDTHFIIVGDGKLKQDLIDLTERLQISDKVIFTGSVPYEEVPHYINACEICVVFKKSLQSGYSPLKLFEYLSCGKPVVASNVPGFELLEECAAGLLAESDNPEDLSLKIISLLHDDQVCQKMGENGRKFVLNGYTWESSAKKIHLICHQAMHR